MLIEQINLTGKSHPPDPAQNSVQNAAHVALAVSKNQSEKEAEKTTESVRQIESVAADLQENLNIMHDVNLQFSVHKKSGRVIVTVKDEKTGEVIREIPPKEMLELADRFDKMIGTIFNQKG